jgi:hypothetical protein
MIHIKKNYGKFEVHYRTKGYKEDALVLVTRGKLISEMGEDYYNSCVGKESP